MTGDPAARSGTFRRGAVATPNRLATAAGRDVLAAGGNAADAAVAAGLVLAVVTPYHCGLGGDVLAMVWDGEAHGLLSVGAAPEGATIDGVRAAMRTAATDGETPATTLPGTGGMPDRDALSVTVPGAVAGWLALLEAHGTWPLARVAERALQHAESGFIVTPYAAMTVARSRPRLGGQPGWERTFGAMRAGERFVQPALARTLRAIVASDGEEFLTGRTAEAIVATLSAHGSAMTLDDLAAHRAEWVTPLAARYRATTVLELPPPTQGVTALTALALLERLGPLPDAPAEAMHLQIEAVRAAMADRQEHLGDPRTMRTDSAALLAPARIAAMAGQIDRRRAGSWPSARPAPGGTAFLCTADEQGRTVSLIQSNFMGFGSGVVVEEAGFGLHNRGAHLSLDAADANALGPARRPMHTLIPAFVLHDDGTRMAMGTMGGDAQAQIHVQLLGNVIDRGLDLPTALAAPRFVVDVADGSTAVEADVPAVLIEQLRAAGHTVTTLPVPDLAGHAHLIRTVPGGYEVASDPRCDGAASGV